MEEALKAIEYDCVATVQIIFNVFRQRPAQLFFEQASKKNVGIIARVPLASGLLSGKFGKDTQFGEDDHRNFNRNGDAFDRGETFSGVDYEIGLETVAALQKAFPSISLPTLALKWILAFNEVSCVIPGASKASQLLQNIATTDTLDLTKEQIQKIEAIYNQRIKPLVHHLW